MRHKELKNVVAMRHRRHAPMTTKPLTLLIPSLDEDEGFSDQEIQAILVDLCAMAQRHHVTIYADEKPNDDWEATGNDDWRWQFNP